MKDWKINLTTLSDFSGILNKPRYKLLLVKHVFITLKNIDKN